MDREKAIQILKRCEAESYCSHYKRHYCCIGCDQREALDLAIEALGQTEIVRCKDCKHYNPPHIEYNDGTRKDYPDASVTVDIGTNVGGKCENSTTTMRTYCLAHHREDPDDFEELVIFREPMEYCSFGEKAEKHQLTGETSTNEGDAESATTTDCISRQDAIAYIDRVTNSGLGKNKSLDYIRKYISALPPVTPTERTGEWVDSEGEPVDDSFSVYCSRCKAWSEYRDIYCGNCGAKMRR